MIAFNKYYNQFNILSISLVVVSLFFLIFKGLNFGIDFKGGTLIELRTTDKIISVSNIRDSLNQLNLGDVSVKNFGTDQDYLIKFEKKDFNNPDFISDIKNKLASSLGNSFEFRRVENVGPKVSSELLKSGIIAIALSLAAMLIYIWIRFEWQFSLGAIVALFFAELSGESLVALSTLAIDSGSDTGVSSFALPFAFTDVLASCSSRVSSTMSLITSSVEDSSFMISSDISSPISF